MTKPAILIVEDEAIVAADLGRLLRSLGYDVAGTAASGEEAIQLAARLRPALVLMDVHLAGGLDGFAAATAIQRERPVPMIFLTATGGARAVECAHHCGACDFIVKPYDEQVLRDKLARALSQHDPERCLRASRPPPLFVWHAGQAAPGRQPTDPAAGGISAP